MEMDNLFRQIDFYRNNSHLKEKAWRFLEEQVALANSRQSIVACILLDIDHFHRLAESQGADVGQLILTKCLSLLVENVNGKQVISYGRDEFMIIVSVKSVEDAVFVAESIRRQLAEAVLTLAEDESKPQSSQSGCSAGVAVYPVHATEAMALVSKAEDGLYLAKRQGRNLTKLPSGESMTLKSNYYSNVQLERLAYLAQKTGLTEASLLRQALERFLSDHDG